MEKFEDLIKDYQAKKGIIGSARAAQVCFYADEWACGRFEAISFRKGTLKLSVASSAASQELCMIKQELIDHVNDKMEKEVVQEIRFVNSS